jgi:chromosome transmission fidelity protein 1
VSEVTPNGIVVFFTSYAYMAYAIDDWRSNGLLPKLDQIKSVFVESKDNSGSEKVWNNYKRSATRSSTAGYTWNGSNINTGAILFCVMGGKMSEGINFSDELARCVVVIGMPYPDHRDPILQMKLNYADNMDPKSSKDLYESMCMKTVNQSIGRAIRHINDYATIILLDARYERLQTIQRLPEWIRKSLKVFPLFQSVMNTIQEFYHNRE